MAPLDVLDRRDPIHVEVVSEERLYRKRGV
jgi:hypothetical protein